MATSAAMKTATRRKRNWMEEAAAEWMNLADQWPDNLINRPLVRFPAPRPGGVAGPSARNIIDAVAPDPREGIAQFGHALHKRDWGSALTAALSSPLGPIVYHGTPHQFAPTPNNPLGEFDLSKIGTGEGAQAYGHGVYLAESPGVAKSYEQALGAPAITTKSGKIKSTPKPGTPADMALSWLEESAQFGWDPKEAPRHYAWAKAELGRMAKFASNPAQADKYNKAIEVLNKWEPLGIDVARKGSTYRVDLPDEHAARMLDWDAPIAQQPKPVRRAVFQQFPSEYRSMRKIATLEDKIKGMADKYGKPGDSYVSAIARAPDEVQREWRGMVAQHSSLTHQSPGVTVPTSGEGVYRMLEGSTGSPENASRALNDVGVPGIKYLDQGSRAAGKGSHNYVVWKPDILKILGRE